MTEQDRRHYNAQRWAYLRGHPLAFVVGVWASLSAVAALCTIAFGLPLENTSSLSELFPTWAETLWAFTYLFGGVCLASGIARLSLRAEVAGCFAIAGVQLINVYAIVVIRGPAAGFISSVGIGVACGLMARIAILLSNRRHR